MSLRCFDLFRCDLLCSCLVCCCFVVLCLSCIVVFVVVWCVVLLCVGCFVVCCIIWVVVCLFLCYCCVDHELALCCYVLGCVLLLGCGDVLF